MKIQEVVDFFEQITPSLLAEDWDNVGLLVGDGQSELKNIGIALDITLGTIELAKASGCNLIISHHPVIFRPLKRLSVHHPAYRLAQYGISALCLHTNFDVSEGGVNDTLAQALNLQDITAPIGINGGMRIGHLEQPISPRAFAKYVAEKLSAAALRHTSGKKDVFRVAVCGGAGGQALDDAVKLADAFVTGEVKHHEYLLAMNDDFLLIDAGHFATEQMAKHALLEKITEAFPNITCHVLKEDSPYQGV